MMAAVQATYPRPVAMPGGKSLRLAQRARGLTGWLTSAATRAAASARRPVLYLGGAIGICHAAWQIWQPLGSLAIGGCLIAAEMLTGPDE